MRHGTVMLMLLVGATIGLRFADIDQHLPFLDHRSILTHGCLASAWLLCLTRNARGQSDDSLRAFTMGFSLAMAVHRCIDLFPRRWGCPALI